jgi:hypothetical protein
LGWAEAIGFAAASESIAFALPAGMNCCALFCEGTIDLPGDVEIVCALAGTGAHDNTTNAKGTPKADMTALLKSIIWFPYLVGETVSIRLRSLGDLELF